MNSGIPAPLSMILLLFIFLSLALRLALLNSTGTDKRLNIALASIAACCAFRDPTVQTVIINWSQSRLSPVLLYHLSEFFASPILGALFLVAYRWINGSEPRYLARIVYAALSVGAIAILVLKIYAWSKIDTFTIDPSLAVIAYSYSTSVVATTAAMVFYNLLFCCFSVMLLIVCTRELRRKLDKRAVVIIVAMAMIAIGLLAQTAGFSIAAIMASAGRRNDFIDAVGFVARSSVAFYGILLTSVAAIPVFIRLLERLQLDKYSRQRRRLLPLWRDLTTACPEIVYTEREHLASNRSRYLLHRTVIEIRDCILILSCYAGIQSEVAVHITADNPQLRQAIRLALACTAKIIGKSSSDDFVAQQSAATDLMEDTQELVGIADQWLKAKKTLARVAQPTVTAE